MAVVPLDEMHTLGGTVLEDAGPELLYVSGTRHTRETLLHLVELHRCGLHARVGSVDALKTRTAASRAGSPFEEASQEGE